MQPDKTIARILKVNHAGEYGAIQIYRSQLMVSAILYKDLVPFLRETLAHEIAHCRIFLEAMPARKARPCQAMPCWGVGGWLLGFITALMGRNAVMICTAAVERAVHKHLQDQLRYLAQRDEELKQIILSIEKEELEHLHYAENKVCPSVLAKPLAGFIARSTDLVIWLSTQGDVTRMQRALQSENGA
jgi:3-demethoxyubiquinol 3-hydroxylase